MVQELFNRDELARIASEASPDVGHESLLAALRARYPKHDIRLVAIREGWHKDGGLIDPAGNQVAESWRDWMKAEYEAAGQDARAVWAKHKDAGLVTTEWRGETLYFTSPSGRGPEEFFQIEVDATFEATDRMAFDPFGPEDLSDLLSPFSWAAEEQELSPRRYQFAKLTNVRRFVQGMLEAEREKRLRQLPEKAKKVIRLQHIVPGPGEEQPVQEIPFLEMFPDWLEWPMKEVRLFRDWTESSPGRGGEVLCRHWFLAFFDYEEQEGRRLGFIPQWADADGGMSLPEIEYQSWRSLYDLMDRLETFDGQTGYPFSWYFYMLHGNRINFSAGEAVAEALKQGKIRLPEHDEKVLLRWHENEYGF